jgi:hypothetical protein
MECPTTGLIERIMACLKSKAPAAGAPLRPEDRALPQTRLFD